MEDKIGEKVATSNPHGHLNRFFVLSQDKMDTKGGDYQTICEIFRAFTNNKVNQYNKLAVLPEKEINNFKSRMLQCFKNGEREMMAKVVILAKLYPEDRKPFEIILAKATNSKTNRDEVLFLVEKDKHFYKITRNVVDFLASSRIVYSEDILT